MGWPCRGWGDRLEVPGLGHCFRRGVPSRHTAEYYACSPSPSAGRRGCTCMDPQAAPLPIPSCILSRCCCDCFQAQLSLKPAVFGVQLGCDDQLPSMASLSLDRSPSQPAPARPPMPSPRGTEPSRAGSTPEQSLITVELRSDQTGLACNPRCRLRSSQQPCRSSHCQYCKAAPWIAALPLVC